MGRSDMTYSSLMPKSFQDEAAAADELNMQHAYRSVAVEIIAFFIMYLIRSVSIYRYVAHGTGSTVVS
jgi:hypothetical protein